MKILSYKDKNGERKPIGVYNVETPVVSQTTGTSAEEVMSQNAVTLELEKIEKKKADKSDIKNYDDTELRGKVEELEEVINTPISLTGYKILYTTYDDKKIEIPDSGTNLDWTKSPYSGVTKGLISNEYYPSKGYGIIELDNDVVTHHLLYNQPTLKSVMVSGDFRIIDQRAIAFNPNLLEIILNDGIEEIGRAEDSYDTGVYTLANNPRLHEIIFPDSVKHIGCAALQTNTNMTTCIFPNNEEFTDISEWLCGECSNLLNIIIPDSVTNIRTMAFGYCTSLLHAHIGEGVKTIGQQAFGRCKALISVRLGGKVEIIENNAFTDCWSLVHINLLNDGNDTSSTIKSLGQGIFSRNYNLTSLVVPRLTSALYMNIISNCSKLEKLIVEHTGEISSEYAWMSSTYPRFIDSYNKSIKWFPNPKCLETLILRNNAVVQDVETYLLTDYDNTEKSEIMPIAGGDYDDLDKYIGTRYNWLKIYVPANLLASYQSTYPNLKDKFHPLTGDDTYVYKGDIESVTKGEITEMFNSIYE